MRIRPFQAVYPNFDFVTSADAFFEKVKYEYPEYQKSGFFKKAPQEAFYIYRIKREQRTHTGLITCVDIRDYLEGRIKKHENTLSAKEQQQMQLMVRRKAIVKPILLTYPNVKSIQELINNCIEESEVFYETTFEKEGTQHLFWEVKDGKIIQKIQQLFAKKVPITYIADGHHRSSTSALMYERGNHGKKGVPYNWMLTAFFPVDELEVHDFNRVVEGLSDISLTTFMAKLSRLFDIETVKKPHKPRKKHEIVMYLNREWFRLRWKENVLKKYKNQAVILDANLLNDLVIREILNIQDIRSDIRIKYIEGPKGLDEIRQKTNKNENRIGFCLYPVALEDLISVADAGETMPPKSTWFEPRIKNGLIVQEF